MHGQGCTEHPEQLWGGGDFVVVKVPLSARRKLAGLLLFCFTFAHHGIEHHEPRAQVLPPCLPLHPWCSSPQVSLVVISHRVCSVSAECKP